MAEPFNYIIQTPDIGNRFMGGFEQGFALNQLQLKAQEEERARQAAEMQAAENQRIQQSFYANKAPTAMDVIQFANTLPSAQVTALKDQFAALPKEAQQRDLQLGGQVLSSLAAGDGQTASSLLRDRAEAMRNAGDDARAQSFEALARLSEISPEIASKSIMPMIAVLPDGDKVVESILKTRKAPIEEAKLSAEASSAATAAKFAESKAVMDLRLNDAQIKKYAADAEIARMNARIAVMNAQTSREGNDLKRQELGLKVQEMIDARDTKMREKVSEVSAAQSNVDNMLNTIDRILKNPSLDDVVGSLEGRMPESASMLDDQESDAIALINTLGSQAFLSQLPNIKGMGQLSNAEGDKLQSALQNVSRAQSEAQFKASLKEAQRLVMKARKNIANRYGVPDTVPDTPAAEPSAAEINDLLRKYGSR